MCERSRKRTRLVTSRIDKARSEVSKLRKILKKKCTKISDDNKLLRERCN